MGSTRPSQAQLQEQIQKYSDEYPAYETFAKALERVLKEGCRSAIPEVIVQARPKSIASFAEKAVRKFARYPNAARDMTDLCGARVIVQTLGQVKAVRQFIDHNFEIRERDDKAKLLSEDRFGYRDLHYLIRLKKERAAVIGFTADECRIIGERTAELQVRSLVQHAWADILHDRMYKAPLKLSDEAKRTGALLAAIMEDGDRSFDQLARELDGMASNYSAYATPENVDNEIATQELLLTIAKPDEMPVIALRLARLIVSKGQWDRIIKVLEPHHHVQGSIRLVLGLELGHALCRQNRPNPKSAPYRRGQQILAEVISACRNPDLASAPNLRRDRSIQARALARLGWSYEVLEAEAYRARENYRQAVELEPGNPYYLADMLGFELKFAAGTDLVAGFRSAIHTALATCRQHATAGTELPGAFYTAGRLGMLLGEYDVALNDYACGVCHCLSLEGCRSCDFIEDEIAWLHRVHAGRPLPEEYRRAEDLLSLAESAPPGGASAAKGCSMKCPVLVVAGSTASLTAAQQSAVTSILKDALADFRGTVISGGTTAGVPGAVGIAAGPLSQRTDRFRLLGYIPMSLPHDAQKDSHYDEHVVCGTSQFSAAQVLRYWHDLLNAGVQPEGVLVLGFGGGSISALEYRLALALGATVGVVSGFGGSADEVLNDVLWASPPKKLFPLPNDAKTLRAFIIRDGVRFDPMALENMAKAFHTEYVLDNQHKIKPDNLKPWSALPDTYKTANIEQASYAVRILEAAGFAVRKADGIPVIFQDFRPEEIELMAQLEHGRWNIERLRDGWRPGPRDDAKKLHNCIVPWEALSDGPDGVKRFDRNAVAAFPKILAVAGWEVYRPRNDAPRT